MIASEYGSNREITEDSLFSGRLCCRQYRDGYRFSVDAVLLAHFPALKKGDRLLDLGTGNGVLGLIILYRNPGLQLSLTGYEVQPDLAELARHNLKSNGFGEAFKVVTGEVCEVSHREAPESYSLVIANPPFFKSGSGRLSSCPGSRQARHRQEGNLDDFIAAASFAVKNRGRVVMIYPAAGLADLVCRLQAAKIFLKRLQLVYPYPEFRSEARLALIEGVKNGGSGTRVLEPLYIYQNKDGLYSPQLEAMYRA